MQTFERYCKIWLACKCISIRVFRFLLALLNDKDK